jgi:hypothetical protein
MIVAFSDRRRLIATLEEPSVIHIQVDGRWRFNHPNIVIDIIKTLFYMSQCFRDVVKMKKAVLVGVVS